MDATEPETNEILVGLPDRIHMIRHHTAERVDDPALADDATVRSYGALAAIIADLTGKLSRYGIRPVDRLMIVSENSLPLAALVLAANVRGGVWSAVTQRVWHHVVRARHLRYEA
jgi:long-chain acyl-CoA synthetase